MLEHDYDTHVLRQGALALLKASAKEAWFKLSLNGVDLILPRYTLLTMHHCLHFNVQLEPYLLVETAHWEKMRFWLKSGGVFLDVGAATGAMCIPFDLDIHSDIRLIAFEPSRRNREYLEKAIVRNNCQRIKVLPYALSDKSGAEEFVDMPQDENATVPYLPETSHLSFSGQGQMEGCLLYDVVVKTLDDLQEELGLSINQKEPVIIKIDVEGFEGKVLFGAKNLIASIKPSFAIDIHLTPGESYDTDQEVRAFLQPYGYVFERIGHVLLATIPNVTN